VRNWRSQMQNQARSLDDLVARFPGFRPTDAARAAARRYPFGATPYYLDLVQEPTYEDPVFRQCVPDGRELAPSPFEHDGLAEDSRYAPVPGLIHRYPDRVVCLATTTCPVYCRHCTRKRWVGRGGAAGPHAIERQVDYVRSHPEVRDVILSGGDPLALSTEQLGHILARFRSVPTVEIVRIGTRAPVTLPMRIDDELCEMLETHHPLWVNTQFNHPREVTPEAAEACARLLRRGIPVGNQAVLLRGVNDRPEVMEELCRALLRIRVRPYYLLQCDPVAGTEHFRTSVSRGREIVRRLFRNVGGMGVPRYVVDAAEGGGKLPVDPVYVENYEAGMLTLRNTDGDAVTYPDPPTDCSAGP